MDNRVSQRLQAMASQWAGREAWSGTSIPDDGPCQAILLALDAKEGAVKIGKETYAGVIVSLRLQEIPSEDGGKALTWSETFRFLSDDDHAKVPENSNFGLKADRNRFTGFAEAILSENGVTDDLFATVQNIEGEIGTTNVILNLVIKSKQTPNDKGVLVRSYPKSFAQERVPTES